jgi:peptidoglycan/LPS O-acetylase OafA/YrhL
MKGQILSDASAVRLPELDGLRAIAILLVLGSHYLSCVPIAWLRWFSERGWVGVDLFFVLSGFLIGGILLDKRAAANYYRVFYLRRFLRIFPLYALLVLPGLLIVICGLQSYFGGHSLAGQSAIGMWFCAIFIQNFVWLFQLDLPNYLVPTWSVAVEEQFYLLLPPLVRNLGQKKLLKILALAIVFAPLLRGIMFFMSGDGAARSCYALLPCRWDSLLLGVVCALAWRDVNFRTWIASRLRWLQIFWWLSVLGSAAMLFGTQGRLDPHLGFLGYTLIDVCFACTLLLAVMNQSGRLHRVLSLPFFKPIATISYGLYLLHSPMIAIAESVLRFAHVHYDKIGWPATGTAVVALAATVLAAAASWKFLESRMIRIGHEYRYQKPAE